MFGVGGLAVSMSLDSRLLLSYYLILLATAHPNLEIRHNLEKGDILPPNVTFRVTKSLRYIIKIYVETIFICRSRQVHFPSLCAEKRNSGGGRSELWRHLFTFVDHKITSVYY